MKNQLLLYSQLSLTPPFHATTQEDWLNSLTHLGLLGPRLQHPGYCYKAGSQFLELICFLGCSPVVLLEQGLHQEDDPHWIYLQWQWHSQPVLFVGDNTRPPHCPHCRHRLDDWRTLIQQPENSPADAPWICPNCQQAMPLHNLNWRKRAAFTTIALLINGIHESEAVPSDRLLQTLQQLTANPWDYSYLRHQ